MPPTTPRKLKLHALKLFPLGWATLSSEGPLSAPQSNVWRVPQSMLMKGDKEKSYSQNVGVLECSHVSLLLYWHGDGHLDCGLYIGFHAILECQGIPKWEYNMTKCCEIHWSLFYGWICMRLVRTNYICVCVLGGGVIILWPMLFWVTHKLQWLLSMLNVVFIECFHRMFA